MAETIFWLSLLVVPLVAATLAFRFGARLFQIPSPSLLQAGIVVGLPTIAAIALSAGLVAAGLPWYAGALAAAIVLPASAFLMLRLVLYRSRRELLLGLVSLALSAGVGCGYVVVAVPLVMRSYQVPTNSMSPTICGEHYLGTCPSCGAPLIIMARRSVDPHSDPPVEPADRGICTRCFQVAKATPNSATVYSGDRFVMYRLAPLRRWDIVVYRHPPQPKQLYVKRLVGLPGETVEVRDGSIWIDGVRQSAPPEIAGMTWYQDADAYVPSVMETFAIDGRPLKLGESEYFVLGDNSPNSYDSRYLGPVPQANLQGTVFSVYFPLRSWKSFPRHD